MRYDGQPRVSLMGLWRLAKTAIFSFSTFPLAVFSFIGYTALIVFVALSAFSLFCRLFTDLTVPGWTSEVLIASFFGAVNALGISILGEYVIRIYDQVRGRPMYLVDRTVNVVAKAAPRCRYQTPVSDEVYEHLLSESSELAHMGHALTGDGSLSDAAQ